jgi:hypothetical protein
VARDVVEDVRLGQIVERGAVSDCDGGGKFAITEAVEEQKRWNVAAHRLGLESSERAEESIDVLQPRHLGGLQAKAVDSLKEARVGIAPPAILHPGKQLAPGIMVCRGVQLIGLVDVQASFVLRLFDERRLGRRQTGIVVRVMRS